MVAYRARGSQQCLIAEHPRFNRDRIGKNFLDRSQGPILSIWVARIRS
jgi:hypothetical protein